MFRQRSPVMEIPYQIEAELCDVPPPMSFSFYDSLMFLHSYVVFKIRGCIIHILDCLRSISVNDKRESKEQKEERTGTNLK